MAQRFDFRHDDQPETDRGVRAVTRRVRAGTSRECERAPLMLRATPDLAAPAFIVVSRRPCSGNSK